MKTFEEVFMPKFTKKHYKAVAAVLRHCTPSTRPDYLRAQGQWQWTVTCFASMFADDNPKFNRELFMLACKFPPGLLACWPADRR